MLELATKLYKAFINSCTGLHYAWRSQWSFRLEIIFLIFALPLAFFITHNMIERLMLIGSILLLPMIELINSAIETTLDRISREYHELSGYAKDMASAAMLIASMNALVIWGFIIFEKFV